MIIIITGLPRNIKKNLNKISNFAKKLQSKVIFSTNNEINSCNLPKDFKVIINEENSWYLNKFNELSKYPKSEYLSMLQWIRLSDALRYIEENKMAHGNTVILKLRTDIFNLDEIQIPKQINDKNFYMHSDLAFAATYNVMRKIDNIFFSKPENSIDLKLSVDVESKYFLKSEKKAGRFEWLHYPKMISTFLPGKLFKYIIKTKFEKLLWIGFKNYENQICFRYYKDIRRFQSEPAFIWNILKAELYAKNISNRSLKLDYDRK
jgi:hypothetical protein